MRPQMSARRLECQGGFPFPHRRRSFALVRQFVAQAEMRAGVIGGHLQVVLEERGCVLPKGQLPGGKHHAGDQGKGG